MKYISVSVYVIPCIRGGKGYCICEEASDTRWSQTIERNFASSLLHQALQRPSTFEQTGLDLELVHSAGSRTWDRGRGWRKGTGLQKNLTHCFSLREGNLAADEVQKAPLDSINTVYKVTWGSHLPICFGPLRKTFAKSRSVGPAIYVPAVSGFFSPYTKLNSKCKE